MSIDISKLEPEAAKSTANGETLALFSIAISLKRIADLLPGYSMSEKQREMTYQLSRAQ